MKKFNELREQYLEEKLKASDPAGKYIHDFVHSDNPKFAGKSKAKRIQMALAASYAAKGKSRNEETEQFDEGMQQILRKVVPGYAKKQINDKMDAGKFGKTDADKDANYHRYKKVMDKVKKEEVEQIDELSKTTLGSYVKNAAMDIGASRSLGADFKNRADKSRKPSAKAASTSLSNKFNNIAKKRHTGISKAVERLSK